MRTRRWWASAALAAAAVAALTTWRALSDDTVTLILRPGPRATSPGPLADAVRQRVAIAGLSGVTVTDIPDGVRVKVRNSDRQRLLDLTATAGEMQIRPTLDYVAYDPRVQGPPIAQCQQQARWEPNPAAPAFLCMDVRFMKRSPSWGEARTDVARFTHPSILAARAVNDNGAWLVDVTFDPVVRDAIKQFTADQIQAHSSVMYAVDGIVYEQQLPLRLLDLKLTIGQNDQRTASFLAAVLSVSMPSLGPSTV
ncbi:hypothetical protein ABH935_000079 [Catenulispora sp. GAS73]